MPVSGLEADEEPRALRKQLVRDAHALGEALLEANAKAEAAAEVPEALCETRRLEVRETPTLLLGSPC